MWARWYGSIVERFRSWATEDSSVRAAMIVGSQARTTEPADEWSDLDLVVFHTEPEKLIASMEWFRRFGTVVLSMVEPTAVLNNKERRVIYSDGRDVDFAVFPASYLPYVARSPEGAAVLSRGYHVLVDKDHQLENVPEVLAQGRRPGGRLPRAEEFEGLVADFWYHILWVAKKLRRGELWTAKMGCDGYLKRLLVPMMEWQATVHDGVKTDVWHDGRFLERWAPSFVRSRIPATFAQYDSKDVKRALRETGQLFSLLAREVATATGARYPADAEAKVWTLVDRTLHDGDARG